MGAGSADSPVTWWSVPRKSKVQRESEDQVRWLLWYDLSQRLPIGIIRPTQPQPK